MYCVMPSQVLPYLVIHPWCVCVCVCVCVCCVCVSYTQSQSTEVACTVSETVLAHLRSVGQQLMETEAQLYEKGRSLSSVMQPRVVYN